MVASQKKHPQRCSFCLPRFVIEYSCPSEFEKAAAKSTQKNHLARDGFFVLNNYLMCNISNRSY